MSHRTLPGALIRPFVALAAAPANRGFQPILYKTSLPFQVGNIPDATDTTDGAMSAADKTKLDAIVVPIPTIWDKAFINDDFKTTTAAPTMAGADTILPKDGIVAMITNVVASNDDGTDWAAWLVAEAVYVRSGGVLTLETPMGTQSPVIQGGATSAGWTIEFGVVDNKINITVVGANGVTVLWSVHSAGNYNRTSQ